MIVDFPQRTALDVDDLQLAVGTTNAMRAASGDQARQHCRDRELGNLTFGTALDVARPDVHRPLRSEA
jgi:hypothetical protein